MSLLPRPIPVTDDHDTGPLFAAAAADRLVVRVCSCGRVLHLPVPYCHQCGSTDGTWSEVSGRGRVHSWTRVTHAVHPAFPVPYTLLLVELVEHPQVHLMSHVPGEPDVHAGQAVLAYFEDVGEGVKIPQWRLVEEAG